MCADAARLALAPAATARAAAFGHRLLPNAACWTGRSQRRSQGSEKGGEMPYERAPGRLGPLQCRLFLPHGGLYVRSERHSSDQSLSTLLGFLRYLSTTCCLLMVIVGQMSMSTNPSSRFLPIVEPKLSLLPRQKTPIPSRRLLLTACTAAPTKPRVSAGISSQNSRLCCQTIAGCLQQGAGRSCTGLLHQRVFQLSSSLRRAWWRHATFVDGRHVRHVFLVHLVKLRRNQMLQRGDEAEQ